MYRCSSSWIFVSADWTCVRFSPPKPRDGLTENATVPLDVSAMMAVLQRWTYTSRRQEVSKPLESAILRTDNYPLAFKATTGVLDADYKHQDVTRCGG
jgi:hypothetical protein